MVGAYVNTGIFFEIFRGKCADIDMYQLYILFDMFMLFVSGVLMYATISEISKGRSIRYIGFVTSTLYLLAYPLNSVLMGSAYLTLSFIFITAIILIWNKKDKLQKKYFILILFLLNLGLVHSYILFGGIVLLAELIAYILMYKRKLIKYAFFSIILPLITLVIYIYIGQDKIVSMLAEEGPMYKNYYSNFIIYVPFIMYAIYIKVKGKNKIDFATILFSLTIIVLPVCYMLKNEKVLSAYFCSKFYYLFWVPTLFLFAKAIYEIYVNTNLRQYKKNIYTYIIVSALIIGFALSYAIDKTKYDENELMEDVSKESIVTIAQIFKINSNIIKDKKAILNKEEIELIKNARNTINLKESTFEAVGSFSQINWIYALYQYSRTEKDGVEALFKLYDVENINTDYVLVLKRASVWRQIKNQLLNKYMYTYENTWGGILQKNEPVKNYTVNGKEPQYNNPIIPVGFKPVEDGASWKCIGDEIEGWNNGLVIEDKDGNQFVWVPVNGGVQEDGSCKSSDMVEYKYWYIYEGKETIAKQDIEYIEGLLGETIKDEIVKPTDIIKDSLPDGIEREEEQIEKYGGFYIARYEAGINEKDLKEIYSLEADYDVVTVDDRNNTTEYMAVSKKGVQVWNSIEYNKAKTVAENSYKTEKVKSGIMTGKQFDTIMKWAQATGYNLENATDWGNFFDTYPQKYTGRYASYLRKKSADWKIKDYGVKDRRKHYNYRDRRSGKCKNESNL